LRRFLKIFPINSFVKFGSAILAPSLPWGSWFEQIWIYTTWGWFHMSVIFPGPVVLEKKIFKEFSYIFLCKTWVGHFGPTLAPGVMIWTNLNLHYLRMIPHECHLSWPSGSGEEDF
jgi:hypothetical protein